MGEKDKKTLGITAHKKRVDQIDAEADELGLSRAEYGRQMFEAGRLLFQTSATLNTELLGELVDEGAASFQTDHDIAELEDDVIETILNKLPADEDRAAEKEEVRCMVYGTPEEQLEKVDAALRQLFDQNRIKGAYDGGYYID